MPRMGSDKPVAGEPRNRRPPLSRTGRTSDIVLKVLIPGSNVVIEISVHIFSFLVFSSIAVL
jgi:hypothetical protein